MGKSTGSGGLAIWTHHVQKIDWIDDFVSASYRGPALKAHAGVSVEQIYNEAASRDVVVVGGDCSVSEFLIFFAKK